MLIRRLSSIAAVLAALVAASACTQEEADAPGTAEPSATAALPRTTSEAGASVFFITPADGATVASPVAVEFGINGMTVVRAGDDTPGSGHHHLLVDTSLPDPGLPIPADQNHIHFGDGSTSTELTLAPGKHTLQLLLGDHLHIPHDPPITSTTISITVE